MTLPAIASLDVTADDFRTGGWSAVTCRAVFTHESPMWDNRRSATIKTVSFGKGLLKADELRFSEDFLFAAKDVTLLTIRDAG
jgi:hypothetical protein